jgi:hypothetical protein
MPVKSCGFPVRLPSHPVGFNTVDLNNLTVCNHVRSHGLFEGNVIAASNVSAHRGRIDVIDASTVKAKVSKVWNELYVNGNSRFVKTLQAHSDGIFRKDIYIHGNIWHVAGNSNRLVAGAAEGETRVIDGNLRVTENLEVIETLSANRVVANELHVAAVKFGVGSGDPQSTLHVFGDALVEGNLRVVGNVIRQGIIDETIDTNKIILNSSIGNTTPPFAGESGVVVNRGILADAQLVWQESTQTWRIGKEGSTKPIAAYQPGIASGSIAVWSSVGEAFTGHTELKYDGLNLLVDGGVMASRFAGSGAELTSLNASSVASGILDVTHGGTGNAYFEPGKFVVGNGSGPMGSAPGLSYDPATDSVSIGGGLVYPGNVLSVGGDVVFAGHLIPTGNMVWDLGSNAHHWRDLYLSGESIFLGPAVISASEGKLKIKDTTTGRDLLMSANVDMSDIVSGTLSVAHGGSGGSAFPKGSLLFGNGSDPYGAALNVVYDEISGALGIGKAPEATLDVQGNVRFSGDMVQGNAVLAAWKQRNDADVAFIDTNVSIGANVASTSRLFVSGDIFATSAITTSSDRRLKTDFQRIDRALDKLMKVSGYTFRRTDDGDDGRRQAGFIAQEVLEVLPECIQTRQDGMLGVTYGSFGALVVEAIKELCVEVRELKSRIA